MGEDLAASGSGNNHPTSIPTGVFRTRNGHINIAASGNAHFGRLCRALGAPELLEDARYADETARSANRDALNAAIEDYTAQRDSADWVDLLNRAGVPCGPINTIDQVFADPQVQHLAIAQPVEHPTLGRINLVGQTPERGEHNEVVLRELGYDDAAIAALRAKQVI